MGYICCEKEEQRERVEAVGADGVADRLRAAAVPGLSSTTAKMEETTAAAAGGTRGGVRRARPRPARPAGRRRPGLRRRHGTDGGGAGEALGHFPADQRCKS